MEKVELTASEMFDRIVQAGLSPEDSTMVAMGQDIAREIVARTEAALEAGEVSEAKLFDPDYREIAGSNPHRYHHGLNDWEAAAWLQLLDRATSHAHRSDTSLVETRC